jgi:hypothetical protein
MLSPADVRAEPPAARTRIFANQGFRIERRDVIALPACEDLRTLEQEREVPPLGRTNSYQVACRLAPLAQVLLTWFLLARILLAGVMPLLAGLLPATLLLAVRLSWILVLLTRIWILAAHSEFSLFRPQLGPTRPRGIGCDGTAVPLLRCVAIAGHDFDKGLQCVEQTL